jgi:acyl carrier protein
MVMEKEFIAKIKEAFEIEDRELNMEDEFKMYNEWNSLAYLSIIAMLDDEYDIQIEEDSFRNYHTIADLYKAIQQVNGVPSF